MSDAVDIRTIEEAIVDRLDGKLPDALVEAFPDDAEGYNVDGYGPVVLVQYAGGDFGPAKDLGAVVQHRRMQFAIHVLSHGLASKGASYDLLEAVRVALTGYQIPGCSKIVPIRDRFVGRTDSLWTHVFFVGLRAPALEVDESVQGPLLQRLTFIDECADDTLEVPAA